MDDRQYKLGEGVVVKEFNVKGKVTLFCQDIDTGKPTYEITFPETQWLGSFCTKVWHCGEDGLERAK